MPHAKNLLTDPIPHLVRSIALPASVGYFFNTMFNVVDTWFAGRISVDALAALGLSFPVFFVVIAAASGLSTGISSILANALGSGRFDDANRLATQSITFTLMVSAIISTGGILLADDAFRWMGAAQEPARLATRYMVIIFAGSVFFNLCHVLNAFLLARGDSHSYRNVLMLGLLLNVVLDPWFIYGGLGLPAMGFDGVAYSTILIQALSCLYLYLRVHQREAMAPITTDNLKISSATASEIISQSGPATLNMATIGIGILVITYFVNEYGSEAVAAYGIATRIEQIILLPAIGLNMAVLAVVGQNNGAGLFDRVRETVRVSLKFGLYVLIPGFLLMVVWPKAAMTFFTDDAVTIRIGLEYLRLAGFLIYAYVLLFTLTAVLQAMKQPMYAIWIGLYRQIIAPLIIIYLLSRHTGLGVWSVWTSVAFTTWSAAIFTGWYTRRALHAKL
jgi:putative MATE family efflux protein